MDFAIVWQTAVFAAVLALILGILLCWFRKVFHVETPVLIAAIRETLPGANCGACGFPGCDGFAAAVAAKTAPPDKCTVSSAEATKARGKLLGMDVVSVPKMALLACRGANECAPKKGDYNGVQSCQGAKISANGTKLCAWGCIGFGDCITQCKFGGISMGPDGIPVFNHSICKGCGLCSVACPQGLIKMVPATQKGPVALCSNANPVKAQVKKTCSAGCIKCGICVKNCPSEAVVLKNGTPVFDYSKCKVANGETCGICAEKCPMKVITMR